MKKLEFKSSDFTRDNWTAKFSDEMAKYAQHKFDEWFKSEILGAPVVYGYTDHGNYKVWTNEIHVNDTHKGRLIMIEPIKPKCEKHEPHLHDQSPIKNTCKHCGVELVAEWKEVK